MSQWDGNGTFSNNGVISTARLTRLEVAEKTAKGIIFGFQFQHSQTTKNASIIIWMIFLLRTFEQPATWVMGQFSDHLQLSGMELPQVDFHDERVVILAEAACPMDTIACGAFRPTQASGTTKNWHELVGLAINIPSKLHMPLSKSWISSQPWRTRNRISISY